MMTMDHHLSRTAVGAAGERSFLQAAWAGIATWVRACGQAYVASAIYQDLSRLSDAELQRRGLSRDALAGEVLKTFGRDD